MKKNNKVVNYYKKQVDALSLRVADAEDWYLTCVKVKFRLLIKNGCKCKNYDELKEREIKAYKQYFNVYMKYLDMYDKYLQVKGVELCQEENR